MQVVRKHDRSPPRSQRSPVAKRPRSDTRAVIQLSPRRRFNPRQPRDIRSRSRSSSFSDDDEPRGPLSQEIMAAQLPKGLEKPPPLGTYDGTTDPDEHIENIDALLDYRGVRGAIKCRLFPTTLRKGAMAWYKSLP